VGRGFSAFVLGAPFALACRSPTEITIDLSTDIACKSFAGDDLYAGQTISVDAGSITSQTGCPAGASAGANGVIQLGTFVLAPAASDSDAVSVLVVGAENSKTNPMTPDQCSVLKSFKGTPCVSTRRSLSFVPHTPLSLPITLYSSCVGVDCPSGETCVAGKCGSPQVLCTGQVCNPPDGGGPPDGSGPDASRDAGVDAPREAGFDASRDAGPPPAVLLFGGSAGGDPFSDASGISKNTGLSDLWIWDGGSWGRVPEDGGGPGPGLFSSMATLDDETVLFGGQTGGQATNQTWTWNGKGWTLMSSPVELSPRAAAAMATLDSTTVVLFGGVGGISDTGAEKIYSDTWLWHGMSWTNACNGCPPGPRFSDEMALLGGRLVLFGGAASGSALAGTDLNSTWLWNDAGWQSPDAGATAPTARDGYAMATFKGKVVLFGGEMPSTGGFAPVADDLTWFWDGSSWTSLKVAMNPGPRVYSAMATFGDEGIILFGGFGVGTDGFVNGTPKGDTWLWNGSAWMPMTSSATPPGPRWGHAMTSR
jgi:hypothetical protein